MAKVYVHEDEDISDALRRFNKKVQKENLMNELRRREYYQKPSDIRKEKARRQRKLRAIEKAKMAQYNKR